MFFKERYAAFYMIAIHNEGDQEKIIEKRVSVIAKLSNKQNPNQINDIAKQTIILDEVERKIGDFKKGYFYAPDVENCIQKSEIHISNPGKKLKELKALQKFKELEELEEIKKLEEKEEQIRSKTFYSTFEQWIRIKALISHPGIVTPTHEERCMQIAYNSKFNSGCISRQVGAVITDRHNSIRSVGWNDVPKGSIPCNLRTLEEIIEPQKVKKSMDFSYSDFELDRNYKPYKNGGNFVMNTQELFPAHVIKTREIGLNHSFCFKSLHNRYDGNDNQVHTRSLHAEENAMLQISKYGGQPLINGTLYTTASPCELCAKKAYQLGIKKIMNH
jgi:deoxycytidylate deaminase